MTGNRLFIHSVFLILLPLIVAWLGLSLGSALALVAIGLLWRWAISLSAFAAPVATPELELETISASHFVEKVRWCLDRLSVEYLETPHAGTLGAFFVGRTVPRLWMRTGAVRSSIGNSAEILRYLWGRYSVSHELQARFLEPTAERLAMEQKIDRCGADLQVWVYYHILDDRNLSLHAWGCNDVRVPTWQRWLIAAIFPLSRFLIRKSFRIDDAHHAKAVEHIDALLSDVETLLADGRQSILGGDSIDYVDISFAAVFGLCLQPLAYGGGSADAVRIERDQAPEKMRYEIERWIQNFPLSTEFIERLYSKERLHE